MKTFRTAAGLLFLTAALSPSLMAQWPSYPSRGVPRTADGKPDLTAPAPKMADGKPDFSGMWENARGGPGGQRGAANGQRGAANAGQRGATEASPQPAAPVGPPLATFFSIGAGLKGLPAIWRARRETQKARKASTGAIAHALAWSPFAMVKRAPVVRRLRP